jgi:hypothetical protein
VSAVSVAAALPVSPPLTGCVSLRSAGAVVVGVSVVVRVRLSSRHAARQSAARAKVLSLMSISS